MVDMHSDARESFRVSGELASEGAKRLVEYGLGQDELVPPFDDPLERCVAKPGGKH